MKQVIGLIREMYKTPRGKGILFFGFYFLIFLILIIIFKFSGDGQYHEKDYELGNSYSFNTSYVENNNYHFEYIITKDNTKYVYVGDRYDDKEIFTFNNKEYYFDGNKYYVDDKEVVNPYLYSKFIDFNNTKSLLEMATYDSRTSYESGVTKYNFLLSSNTINSIFDNKETDIDEEPNSITISTSNNGIMDEITYHLDSYCDYEKDCNNKLEISLNYSKFGEIKEIVNN